MNCELLPLSWTEGAVVGSTLIDFKASTLIQDRLESVRHYLCGDVQDITAEMMHEKFEIFKCSFGAPGTRVPKLYIPIPGLQAGVNVPHASIEDSKLVITRYSLFHAVRPVRWLMCVCSDELQRFFDHQVEKMYDLIDKQIKLVQDRHSSETIVGQIRIFFEI